VQSSVLELSKNYDSVRGTEYDKCSVRNLFIWSEKWKC